jgi:hypothetical protein
MRAVAPAAYRGGAVQNGTPGGKNIEIAQPPHTIPAGEPVTDPWPTHSVVCE